MPVGKVSTTTITAEQEKLSYLEKTGVLYKYFFNNIPRKLLKKYHDRVATFTPSRLVEIKDSDSNKFYGLLARFCKYKGGKIIDNFIEILIKKLKKSSGNTIQERIKTTYWIFSGYFLSLSRWYY